MKKDDIRFGDWQRIFLGDVPGGFYWEVLLRIAIIYIILMVSMRMMGKRMASQISRNEMIAMVSLAAAIGVPLQSPDRGILAAVVIAFVVIFIQQMIARMATRNQRLESLTQGDLSVIVFDSRLNLREMRKNGITREKAFSQLRSRGIRHLGEVKRLYFEASGAFSVVWNEPVTPGLMILPENDTAFGEQVCEYTETMVCKRCGGQMTQAGQCLYCNSKESLKAVL
jgi:uncharacterized membrane protein YcaP (DUF421 family)